MTNLLLIRHGEATHNVEDRWDGWGPSPLTPMGHRQAQALAWRLASWSPAVSQLCTSPIHRARQTAQYIAVELKLEPVARDELREIHFGQLDGLTMDGFRQTFPDLFERWRDRGNLTFQYPGGEQRLAFFQRAGRAIDEIAARHPGEWVAIVAHGGTLRAGLAHLLPDTMSDWWAYDLSNGSLTHVRVQSAGNELIALNDCRHLADVAGT